MSSQQRLFDVLRNRGSPAKVYGRDEELGLVQVAFDRVAKDDSLSSEVVLIHGPSGCGKSAIVKALKQWTDDKYGDIITTFFGTGKYDQLVNNEPFAAIVAASNELCENVLKAGPHIVKRFNDRFKSMVDGDATVLSNAIPALTKLLQEGSNSNKKKKKKKKKTGDVNQPQDLASATQAFTRFKHLWRSLLLAIACCTDVVVLFLDDVQWADANSLDLIHTMTKATRAHNILFVCAFRDDATVEKAQEERIRWCFSLGDKRSESFHADSNNHHRSIANVTTKLPLPQTDIALTNLNDQATVQFVMGVLYVDQQGNKGNCTIDKNRVVELSAVLHNHTNGNAFFILYYLDFLSNIGLLNTNDNGATWEWDLSSIANQSHTPTSIAELLGRVIGHLPNDILQVLTIGAHVGFEFSSDLFQQPILANYINAIDNTSTRHLGASVTGATVKFECADENQVDITGLLEAAVQEGLLEDNGRGAYAFPHDQIQHALYSRVSRRPNEQKQLHLCIGKAMLYIVEADQKRTDGSASGVSKSKGRVDTTLFVAVDNMNKGSKLIDNPEDRDAIIRLNYDAACAALGKSAIEGAIQYIRAAVALLPLGCWTTLYELTLDIYSMAARLEHNAGNSVKSRALVTEIQLHTKTVLDKLPSYFTEIDMLGAQRKLHEALTLGCMVLKELGEPVTPKPGFLAVIFELRRATKLMNKTKAAGFASLGLMTDPRKTAAMSVLSSLFPLSILIGASAKNLTAVFILRMATMSCLYGLSPHSPYAFVGFATVEVGLRDFSGSKETALSALNLIDRIPGADALAGRTKSMVHGLVSHWWEDKSLADIQPECIRSFHTAMAHGGVDQGFFNILHYFALGLIRGTPIDELNADFEKYIQAMDEYQINHIKSFALSFWRPIRMLTGKGDCTTNGDTLGVTYLYKSMKDSHRSELMILGDFAFESTAQLLLGTYGDDLEEDKRRMQIMVKERDSMAMHLIQVSTHMSIALGCMVLYEKTKQSKYYGLQRKMLKELEKYYAKKAPIVMGPYLLIAAEIMANKPRRKTWEDIQQAYLEAMEASRQCGGFIFVEAYGYEKLVKLAEARSDGPKVLFYLQEALATYTQWGATAKITELTERLSLLR